MKVAVIGGGSTYTPELIQGFLDRVQSLPLTELWLMDIDPEKLAVVGGFAQRMAAAKGSPFQVVLTQDRSAAIRGASYVITQLRVGRLPARRSDEYLGRKFGLIGQETTGVGGMAKALRTVPVLLEIAREIQDLAPDALLVNFTNPSGLITEAITRYAPGVAMVGLCNSPTNAKMTFLGLLQEQMGCAIEPQRAALDSLGINHLIWHRGFTLDGKDVWPAVLGAYLDEIRGEEQPQFDPSVIESLGMIPSYYLEYYYETQRMLEGQEKWPPSRAEEVMKIEAGLLEEYANPAISSIPDGLMKRGGAYYSTAATQLINSHCNDLGEVHIVDVRHQGAVPGWSADWVLELPCRVDRAGVHPLPARPLLPACAGLLAHVKSYELLAVEAAVHGDRDAAAQALLAHPLGPPAHQVWAVLEEMLEINREYLPAFRGAASEGSR
jgi:6-phospho-beta-glucosidase